MSVYDLYGVKIESLQDARALIERTLLISLNRRESVYQAGEYFSCGDEAGEHFVLKRNVDPFDDEPAELAFPEIEVLFYVNDTNRSSELRGVLAKKGDVIALLRHENL